MKNLRRHAEMLGLSLSDKTVSAFETYFEMLIKKNEVMNLTSITDPDEAELLHFTDSISLLSLMQLPEGASVIDIGTGAGFPGIPLKLVRPDLQVTLLDSLNKRVLFLQEVISRLRLTGISAIHGRAEDAAREKEHRDRYDFAVSRAVARTGTLVEYALPFVAPGGCFIAYKSGDIAEEASEAENAIRLLKGESEPTLTLTLPESDVRRSFLVIKKTGPTPKRFPRKAGTAKREPL